MATPPREGHLTNHIGWQHSRRLLWVAGLSRLGLLALAVLANLLLPDHEAQGVTLFRPPDLRSEALKTFTR
jgi:hypothetical protein